MFDQDFYFTQKPFNYPNPATGLNTTIRYVLSKSPTSVSIKIFTIDGVEVYDDDNLPVTTNNYDNQGNPIFEYAYECKSNDGDPLADGVYIFVIKASDGNNTIYGKNKLAIMKE